MQEWPLLVSKLLDHAALNHPGREIVTQSVEGPVHRTNWRDVADRSRRLAQWLSSVGVAIGDRVGTLAWNTHRHVEAWYGVTGAGGVVHTINPRLFPEQILYIIRHAADRVLMFDLTFLPLVESLAQELSFVEQFVVMTDAAHMPDSPLKLLCYEDLLQRVDGDFAWVAVDENASAGLSYTSGTTGDPKGVLYTHRANILVAFAMGQADQCAMSARSCVLPVVPMYHANGWALPWMGAMVGAKLVLPGPNNDPATLYRLIHDEGVTLTAAVPTVWQAMLEYLADHGGDLGKVERVVVGGAATPRSMFERFEREHGVTVINAWGMTEMAPLGTIGMLCAYAADLPYEEQLGFKVKQGRAPFGIEMKVTDEAGMELPRDGRSSGALKVRGAWVVDSYYGSGESALDPEGWFDTGDIAAIDPHGYLRITDRAKDVIKSGGEWISSIELENAVMSCSGVAEAAVIGVPHPKWDERPLLLVRRTAGSALSETDVYAHLTGRIAKWWTPDTIIFVDDMPHTATGKIQKTALRERFGHVGSGRMAAE